MLLRVDFPACFSAAPPDYNSVVTEEEAEQNSAASRIEEDLSAVLERPFMAYVQEFRFRPPPVYSEVRSMRVFSNEGKHDELVSERIRLARTEPLLLLCFQVDPNPQPVNMRPRCMTC